MVDGAHGPRREEEEEEQIKNLGILKDNDRLTSSSYSFIYSTTGGSKRLWTRREEEEEARLAEGWIEDGASGLRRGHNISPSSNPEELFGGSGVSVYK